MTGDIFTKLVLRTLEKRLNEKISSFPNYAVAPAHLKKEKDKYSTYLRQLKDLLELFVK